MSKVTSKLQVTLPKAVARQLGIELGDEIDWEVAGDAMRVVPVAKRKRGATKNSSALRLRFFDQATRRQKQREKSLDPALLRVAKADGGWTREDLYTRGGAGRH
jgi:AbrB family looped-hinge helix DNA binding protein